MSEEHGMGRVVSPPDARDANFPARMLMTVDEPVRAYRRWYSDVLHIDQGQIGQCTATSLGHILHDGPFTHRPYWVEAPAFDTIALYCRAQQLDGQGRTWCSHRNDTGATMRSAARAAREGGWIANFWWFATADEALVYLTNHGPVWVGTWWTAGMDAADERGFIRYKGRRLGGHAYVINEVSWNGEFVGMKNSWGQSWGKRGSARITFHDFERLLADSGEALAITEQRV